MADEYHQAQSIATKRTEDEAFRLQFGLTPLELGHELLKAQNMPEEILSALQRYEPAKVGVAVTPSVQRLALAEFSEQACVLVFDSNVSQAEFEEQSKSLSRHFARALPGLGEKIDDLIQIAERQLLHFSDGLDARHFPRQFQRCLRSRIDRTDPPPRKTSRPDRGAAALPPGTANAFEHLKKLVSDASTTDETLYTLSLSIVSRALEAPECMLFLRPAGSPLDLRIVHGTGQIWRQQRSRAAIQPSERTVFGLCLSRRENILIHNALDASFRQHLPEWLAAGIGLGSFVLIPFVDRHASHGVLLAGWREPRQIVISDQHKETFHTLNRLLAGKNAKA